MLIGALFLLVPLFARGDAALTEPFGAETEMSCETSGYPEEACRAYAQCMVAALLEEPGLLSAAHRRFLDDEQRETVSRAVADCAARTL